MRPWLALAALIALGGCGGEGPTSASDGERDPPPSEEPPRQLGSHGAVSSCGEGIPGSADHQWRKRSLVAGPFGVFGPGRDFRRAQRRGDSFVTKLPAIVARGAVVTLRIPERELGSVALGYAGVNGHVPAVTFQSCADRPLTAWPGELVLENRRPVSLIVEVEGAPRASIRVGRI